MAGATHRPLRGHKLFIVSMRCSGSVVVRGLSGVHRHGFRTQRSSSSAFPMQPHSRLHSLMEHEMTKIELQAALINSEAHVKRLQLICAKKVYPTDVTGTLTFNQAGVIARATGRTVQAVLKAGV